MQVRPGRIWVNRSADSNRCGCTTPILRGVAVQSATIHLFVSMEITKRPFPVWNLLYPQYRVPRTYKGGYRLIRLKFSLIQLSKMYSIIIYIIYIIIFICL